ncbi:hypothetical protein M413DRAFT_259993 [Hebeloma cylindrosporum]|uniref:Uncharacterized protein n=1 Tax=Hebeloma cylindrosporum TaxID=76867 RepID=A0A0C3CRF1_HEBCY|nr:hypothetical protein M413DRAFT_259993 [Hebeloma cylindrosporum h7]
MSWHLVSTVLDALEQASLPPLVIGVIELVLYLRCFTAPTCGSSFPRSTSFHAWHIENQ